MRGGWSSASWIIFRIPQVVLSAYIRWSSSERFLHLSLDQLWHARNPCLA